MGKPLPFLKRQEILHHIGHMYVALIELRRQYPLMLDKLQKIPFSLLPFTPELVGQAIREELDNPDQGAALREKGTAEWVDNLKALHLVIGTEYVSDSKWAQNSEERLQMRQKVEAAFLSAPVAQP